MSHTLKKIGLSATVVLTLSAFIAARPHPNLILTGSCKVLTPDDSEVVLNNLQMLMDSDSESVAFRTEKGIPSVAPDSLRIYHVDSACDAAAVSYQQARVNTGQPNFSAPVALVKLGGSTKFLGTSKLREGELVEYIVVDSALHVTSRFQILH